ncbi:rod shape-determining protein RodA [Hugenholtzia roseola]|uniref:rod shape-determining protein RodA n=1 Tax=Hugenholtzia roseola TaxID=1002 RepID=UPI00040E3C73|nr:rod shape-determining protein RodA [Hugenholtzia roseola]
MPKSENQKLLSQVDWLSLFIYFSLVAFGWISIYAAIYNEEATYTLEAFFLKTNAGKQALFIGLSFILITFIIFFDVRVLTAFAPAFYGGAILLLIAVLVFGREVANSKSWFEIGGFRFQPAEFAKMATALMLAFFLGRTRRSAKDWRILSACFAVILIPALLTLLQGDTGSALVFASFSIVFYREGMPSFLMVAGLVAIGLLVATLLMLKDLWGLLQNLISVGGALVLIFQLIDFLKRRKEDRPKVWVLVLVTILNLALLTLPFWIPEVSLTKEESATVSLLKLPAFQTTLYWIIGFLGSWFLIKFVIAFFVDKLYKGIWLAGTVLLLSLTVVLALDFFVKDILREYQRRRLEVLIDPSSDKKGFGWQVHHSKAAIASGGLTGKGFLQGTHTKLNYVPDQSTDFIFCTIGEEQGWVGTMLAMLLFIALLFRISQLAERQKSRFARVYGYGVLSVLFFHFLVNIGMTIGLFPVIGIPLPFFSYGGSSLFSFTLLLVMFIKFDAHRKEEILVL